MAQSAVPATVEFHGTQLIAIDIDGVPHAAIRPICEALTVDWAAQRKRILRNPVLSKGVVITTIPSGGGEQDTICLPLDMLNGWLFGISAARVRDLERRARLVQYQRECFDVLAAHFYGKSGSGPTTTSANSYDLQSNAHLRNAYAMAASAAAVAQPAIFQALLADPEATSDTVTVLTHIGFDGKAHSQLVRRGSFIASLDRLPILLAATDSIAATDAQLLAIAQAAMARVGHRHGVAPVRVGYYQGEPPQMTAAVQVQPRADAG